MKAKDLTITIEPHSAAARSLLPDVINQLESLVRFLRSLTDEDTTFEVVSLSKQSPMTAVLRPLVKTAAPRKRGEKKTFEYKQFSAPAERTARTFSALTTKRKLPAYADPYALLQLREFADDLEKTGHFATIRANEHDYRVDEGLKRQIDSSLGDTRTSYTSFTGVLERMNVHGSKWSFTIFPPVGPSRILCYFPREDLEVVRGLIREVVTVRGRAIYRGTSPWPLQIHVDSIRRREPAPDAHWAELPGRLAAHWTDATEEERELATLLEGLSA